jgi:hypothetical protein
VVVGSFIGGFRGYLPFDGDFDDGEFLPAGFIGSIGAVLALLTYRAATRRGTVRRV